MTQIATNTSRNVSGRIAVITGSTKGIGFETARELLKRGAIVAVNGRTQASVNTAVAELESLGKVIGVAADVSIRSEAERLIHTVAEQLGGIDILINNAGLGIFHKTAELAPEDWDRMIALNLSAPYYCSHAVLPIIKQRGGGDIIHIGSLAGKNAFAGGAGYNASKFGLKGFGEAMMLDHREDGVRVAAILPGSVDTGFGDRAEFGSDDWKIAPGDIAEIAVWMLETPRRTLVSRVEVRPARPAKKG